MNTVKINVSFLAGPALDWAVATCKYDELAAKNIQYPEYAKHYPKVSPSTNWAQGGPIIERECIEVSCIHTTGWTPNTWNARHPLRQRANGPTPLIAAMRCYVASKLGEIVEVPSELFKEN